MMEFQTLGERVYRLARYSDVRAALEDTRFVHWTMRDGRGSPFHTAVDRWLDAMDPSNASPVRELLLQHIGAAAMRRHRERVAATAGALLAGIEGDTVIDCASGFAAPLVHTLLAEILGVDACRQEQFAATVGPLCESIPALMFAQDADAGSNAALASWMAFLDEVDAGDGMVNALRRLDPPLAPGDVTAFAAMLVYAAFVNVTTFIALAIWTVGRDPQQWDELGAAPARIAPALEELLRRLSPLRAVHLVTRETIVGADIVVPPGSSVFADLAAANHDDERSGHHLAFGAGALACIGAALARMQSEIALSTLVSGFMPSAPLDFPLLAIRRR
ncbi:MAG TPA: cytochrome P450 [Candidatus Lustribacter sp.]|jgi:cytochrome P450|nr:cytochrome P450 [Candidatus Lustribacter sp.]